MKMITALMKHEHMHNLREAGAKLHTAKLPALPGIAVRSTTISIDYVMLRNGQPIGTCNRRMTVTLSRTECITS